MLLLNIGEWASLAAIISAMCDVLNTGRDTYEFFYKQRLSDPNALQRAAALQHAFSTYTDREIERIKERVEGCHDRFIKEGSGTRRTECLCSVLTDVKDGNGGSIPDFDNWPQTYDKLGCA